MLVSHRYQFIYTKTLKTASTSVEVFFEPFCLDDPQWRPQHHREEHSSAAGIIGYRGPDHGDSTWYNHMSAALIRERLGEDTWNDYLKFCVVRNPFDLLVSQFWFQYQQAAVSGNPVQRFQAWLEQGIPVSGRSAYMIDQEWCLDTYLRYESLEADLERLCARLNIPFDATRLPQLKKGFRDHSLPFSAYYTKDLAARVAAVYAPEIERFAYELT